MCPIPKIRVQIRIQSPGSVLVKLRFADLLYSDNEFMLDEMWHALLALPLSIEM